MSKYEERNLGSGVSETYLVDKEKNTEKLIFITNKNEKLIDMMFEIDEFPIKKIRIKGFNKLPKRLGYRGYYKNQLVKLFKKKFIDKNLSELNITKDEPSSILIKYNKIYITINYSEIEQFFSQINNIETESKREKSIITDELFEKINPDVFPLSNKSKKNKINKLINNLDTTKIDDLDSNQRKIINQLFINNFNPENESDEYANLKLKMDTITIDNIISDIETMLNSTSCSESDWGKFLEKNIFLINSKYILSVKELHLVLGGDRKVDFGLIDYQGYLDIFEIKKPNTHLLSSDQDRGNHYWHPDAVKAITQIEKYLYNAERKAANLAEDLLRNKKKLSGVELKVTKPNAILIMGSNKQLDTKDKKEDFRILRNSLKNVEIILYDELLEQLKNQREKLA